MNLHTHVVVLNVCFAADGKARTLLSRPFYRWKMAAGALYRQEFARQLSQRLGVEIRPTRNGFEIDGIRDDLLHHFSKRRSSIVAELNRSGRHSARAAAVITKLTRPKKQVLPWTDLQAQWRNDAERLGFKLSELQGLLGRSKPREMSADSLQDQIAIVVSELTEDQAHFSRREIERHLAPRLLGTDVSIEDIDQAVGHFLQRNPEIVHLREHAQEAHFTTRSTLDLEASVLTAAEKLAAQRAFAVRDETVEQSLRQHVGVAERAEQAAALRNLLGDSSLAILNGMPGTGKTHVLKAAREAWERDGYRVIGVALAGKTARGLQESSGIRSSTLEKLLVDNETTTWDAVKHHARMLARAAISKATWKPSSTAIDHRTVIVVDEAGMLGTWSMHRLLSLAAAKGAKVVLVGDGQQIPPIEAGTPFRAMGEQLPAASLHDIQRQRDPADIEAIHALAKGDLRAVLANYQRRGRLTIADDRRQATDKLLADWKEAGGLKRPEDHGILVCTNADRRAINERCQQERAAAGELNLARTATIRRHEEIESQGWVVTKENLVVGDRVMCLQNNRRLGVENGTCGVVASISLNGRHISLELDGKRKRLVSIDLRDYSDLTLAYAATAHKFQGATLEHAYVLLGGTMQGQEMTYVQISRARESTRLYADKLDAAPQTDSPKTSSSLDDLERMLARSQRKLLAHDLLPNPNANSHSDGRHDQVSEIKTPLPTPTPMPHDHHEPLDPLL